MKVERIGAATLYLADCMDVLPTLSGVQAVVSDPPYGMAWNTDSTRFSGGQRVSNRKRGAGRSDWGAIQSDDEDFDPSPWLSFPKVVLWGANHYAGRLPKGTTLVWLKKADHLFGSFLSDAEIAWQKGGHGVYVFRKQFPPPSRAAEWDGQRPAHPTQKPVSLMAWCLQRVKASGPVLDPFMGSGSTGVACVQLGLGFVGIERDPRYFDIACERISQAAAQGSLLQPDPIPQQQSLIGDAA